MSDYAYAEVCEDMIVGNPRAFAKAVETRTANESQPDEHFSVCYRPSEYDEETQECPGFKEFISIAYACGNLTIVIDEAHLLCTSHSIPPQLRNAAVLGRHRSVSVVYITQSFTMVSRTLRLNTDLFCFYRIMEPSDLEGIRERCGENIESRVRELRKLDMTKEPVVPGELLAWNAHNGIIGQYDLTKAWRESWRAPDDATHSTELSNPSDEHEPRNAPDPAALSSE